MKKALFTPALLPLMGLIFLMACSEQSQMEDTSEKDVSIHQDLVAEAAFMEVEELANGILENIDFNEGRTAPDARLRCATITHDAEARTIRVDFGDGCLGPDQRVRAGLILISYTAAPRVPGSVVTTTTEGFSVDGISLEGVRTVSNISDLQNRWPRFLVRLQGGKMIWPDGTFARREVQLVRTIKPATSPEESTMECVGWTRGHNRNKLTYATSIARETPVVYIRNCRVGQFPVPVSGIKQFKVGQREFTVDYGDGTCDREVIITANGESRQVTLRPEWL
jgi:hypothetical protein